MNGFKSWKTTVAGFLCGLSIVLGELADVLDGVESTGFDMQQLTAGLALMGIGWFSRDADKSSEDMGVKAKE